MKFVPQDRLENPQYVTGKEPDPLGLTATLEEVEATVNEQIAGMSREEIFAGGWLHREGDFAVDGWSGVAGKLLG